MEQKTSPAITFMIQYRKPDPGHVNYTNRKNAVDIDNEHWSEFAGNKKNSEFKIIGNNNPIWDRKMSVPYYVNHFTTGNIN